MSEDLEYTIKVSQEGDGARRARDELDKVGASARKAGEDAATSGGRAESALGRAARAAGETGRRFAALRSALALGGVGAALGSAFNSLRGIVEAVNGWRAAQKNLADDIRRGNAAAGYEAILRSHREIADALRDQAEALSRARALEQLRLRNARELEDAQARLSEEREVSADPSREAETRARWAARRAARDGERAVADAESASGARRDEAAALGREIAEKRRQAAELAEAASGYSGRAAAASSAAAGVSDWFGLLGWRRSRRESLERAAAGYAGQASAAMGAAAGLEAEVRRLAARQDDLLKEARAIREGVRARRLNAEADAVSSSRAVSAAGSARERSDADALRRRAGELRRRAEGIARDDRRAADAFAPAPRADYGGNFGRWNADSARDRRLEGRAESSGALSRASARLAAELDRMDVGKISSSLERITARLAALQRAVDAADERSRRNL